MNQYKDLTDQLVSDLETKKFVSPLKKAVLFTLATFAFVIFEFEITGGFREGWYQQLLAYPWFAFEFVLGLFAACLASFWAFHGGIPSLDYQRSRLVISPLIVFLMLLMILVLSLDAPSLPASMAGKRPHCVYETILFSLVPLAVAIYLLRSAAPIRPAWAALSLGLASAIPAAILMHIGCMYEPSHVLRLHILPVLALSFVCYLSGRKLLKWW